MEGHISNIKQFHMADHEVAKAISETSKKAYSFKSNLRRLRFHYNLFRKSESSLNDVLYKTIFAQITQRRMGRIIKEDSKFLSTQID
jgi:hypothetical protein